MEKTLDDAMGNGFVLLILQALHHVALDSTFVFPDFAKFYAAQKLLLAV